jgi:surfeit locus 1 family protein
MTDVTAPAARIARTRASRLVVLLAALIVIGVTARLGVWQLDRAAQKQALADQITERSGQPPVPPHALPRDEASAIGFHSRSTILAGRWLPGSTVFLDNRQMHGRPGFFVVTALQLDGRAEAVLVQRGWVPRDVQDRQRVPAVPTPGGPVQIPGRIAPPPARLFEFAGVDRGLIRQNVDVAGRSAELGVPLLPLSILQTDPSSEDGLLRDWPLPAVDVHKHHGYAFQWFALSALTAGLYVWFQIVRPRRQR